MMLTTKRLTNNDQPITINRLTNDQNETESVWNEAKRKHPTTVGVGS